MWRPRLEWTNRLASASVAVVGICDREKRRGFRSGVACGSDKDDAAFCGSFERGGDLRVAGTGEAHVDDACPLRDRPIDSSHDAGSRGLLAPNCGGKGSHG